MVNSKLDCIGEMKDHLVFSVLTEEDVSFIQGKQKEIPYRKGEYICKQGSFASQIMYIKKGVVKIFTEHPETNIILTLETKGALIGLPALYTSKVFPYSVVPFEDAVICMIDIQDFQLLMRRNSLFAIEVVKQLNDYTLRSYDRLHCLTHKQLHGRFADILLCLMNRIYFGHHFTTTLSRRDLSELTVMSTESLSRIIKYFNDEGIIKISGKEIEILDKDRLFQISKLG